LIIERALMFDRAKYKLGTFIFVLILFSLLQSCNEMVYMLHGEETQATLRDIKQVTTGRRGSGTPMLEVNYVFDDPHSERARVEADRVSLDFMPSVSQDERGQNVVAIEYMPGNPMQSRLKGHDAKTWMYVFFGSITLGAAIAGLACWSFYKK
jgi:hypothetical protein